MGLGLWLRAGSSRLKKHSRTRQLMVECFEARRVLADTSFSTLQLLVRSSDSLAQATILRLDSYALGAKSSLDVFNGGIQSLPDVDALTITANQQENPATVFGQIAKVKRYEKAVLTQRDVNGDAVSAWVFASVSVVSENIRFDGNATLEELSLKFSQITEASSQGVSSWDLLAGRPVGPTVPAEITFKPYVSVSSSTELQLFTRSTDATPAVVLKLDSFQFGAHNALDQTKPDGGLTFDKLEVIAPMSSASPLLFKALTTGSVYATAKLTQRDTTGSVTGTWSMRVAAVVDQRLNASEDSLPVLDLDFDFSTLSTATQTTVFQWDRATGREIPGGTIVPPKSSGNGAPFLPGAPVVATGITLDLQGGTAPAVSLFLDTFSFGVHNTSTYGSGQISIGPAFFDAMDVSLAMPNDAPRLLMALLTSKFYATATLTQRNSLGGVTNVWVLGTVQVTDTQFAGESSGSTAQNLSFQFFSMSHATSTDTATWNQVTQRVEGPPLPATPVIVPLPNVSSALSLNLFSSASNVPTLSVPVNDFVFGSRGVELLDSGTTLGLTSFDPLEVTTVYQNPSPKLLTALTRNTQYVRATLTKSTLAQPITLVTLGAVYVTDSLVESSDGDGEGPKQTLRLIYGQITESAGSIVKSWDVVTAKPIGPAPLPGPDLADLPVPTGNLRLVLGRDATSVPEVDVLLKASDFGFVKSSNAVQFDSLRISGALGAMSPKLLAALTSASAFIYGRLTQVDDSGNTIADWQLRNVYLKSAITSGDQEITNQDIELSYQSFVQQVGSTRNQWDRVLNKGDFFQSRNSNTAGKSPTSARDIRNGIMLELSGGNAPTLNLALSTFDLGYLNLTGPLGERTSYLPLDAALTLTPESASLFNVMAAGKFYATATIKKYENSAFPTAAWVLSNVFIQTDKAQSAGSQADKRISFAFDNLTTLVATQIRLEASSPSIVYGQSTTLTATVSSGSTLLPSGAVTFTRGGQTLATVPLDATGKAVYTLDSLSANGSPYTVEAVYEATSQFLPSGKSLSISVAPALLTVAADNKTKVYGSANPMLTATISGLVNNDSESVVTGLALSTTATISSPPSSSPYPITASGASAANYEIQYVAGGLTVTAVELVASGVTFTPTAGAPFSGVVATFTLPGPAIITGSFLAQIAWGNGRSSAGVVTQSGVSPGGTTYFVTGKHTFGTSSLFNLLVSLRHTSGLTAPVTVSSLAFVTRLGFGQTQTAQYWSSSAGQSLIKSFNGGSTRTDLASWLASSLPNIYGAQAGANNLIGKTNANVASFYLNLTRLQRSLDQEVLATALNVYASTLSLGGAAGGKAGFQVTSLGLSVIKYNVGNRGAAFNVADNTQLSVQGLLEQINSSASNGILYGSASELRATAEQMLEQINVPGISGVLSNQVQPVDFWTSERGVSLIKLFGGMNSKQLSAWLALNYRNLYGANAGVNALIGKTNTQVATYLQSLSSNPATQAAAQVLTSALNLYATTLSLGGPIARSYGFNVNEYGLGAGYFNIDQSGSLVGVANRSTINVYALLQALDRQSGQGNLLGGNASLLAMCQELCQRLNSGNSMSA